jgi:hypothetical protein
MGSEKWIPAFAGMTAVRAIQAQSSTPGAESSTQSGRNEKGEPKLAFPYR